MFTLCSLNITKRSKRGSSLLFKSTERGNYSSGMQTLIAFWVRAKHPRGGRVKIKRAVGRWGGWRGNKRCALWAARTFNFALWKHNSREVKCCAGSIRDSDVTINKIELLWWEENEPIGKLKSRHIQVKDCVSCVVSRDVFCRKL